MGLDKGRNSMRKLFWSAVVVCLLPSLVLAQSRNTGEIKGTVTDSTHATLAGATVTVTNLDTGVTKIYVTNADGIYDTVSTQAGNYSVTFTAQGFGKLTKQPIVLPIDTITVDAILQVGQAVETVTVSEGAPLLETETSHLGTIFEAQTIDKLPQIGAGITGNDWANFNILLPGASSAPSQPASEGSGAYNAGDAISLNGNLPNYANYLQDGGVVQLPVSNNVDNTLFEGIQEVQITTSSFSAEYGIGGAVFNQITKSGTNSWHGSAYEYWQNDILNAPPYFWTPNAAKQLAPTPKTPLRYDEYGGSIGGPILKNKLFFFFVTDKIYNFSAPQPTTATVPTLAERGLGTAHPGAYDFTGLPTIYDPKSCNTQPGCQRVAFSAENTGSLAGVNAIPATAVSAVALKILNLYPLPTATANTSNFHTSLPAPNPNLRFFGRIDYDVAQNNRLSFSISQKDNPAFNRAGPLPCPINCYSGDIDGYNAQVTDTWQIGPTMVNEVRMAYTKQGNWFNPQTLGLNPGSQFGLQYAKANVIPIIQGGTGSTPNPLGGSQNISPLTPGINSIYIEHLYDPSDVLTLIKGKHTLKFGVEVLMGDGNTTPWGNVVSGNFQFTGSYTAQSNAFGGGGGLGLADFLLGDAQSWRATNQTVNYNRLKSPQLFVQDDFKLRPNLTVNLGLRYVATTGFSEKYNNWGGFDPSLQLVCSVDKSGNPCVNLAATPPISANGSLGSMWFAGQDGRNSAQKAIHDIFLPRVGFAWSIRNDTVIRGGFGMYSYNFSQDVYGGGSGTGSPKTNSGTATDPNSGTFLPYLTLDMTAAQAAPLLNYVAGTKNVSNYVLVDPKGARQGVTEVPYDVRPGQISQWQLSVEHSFANSYMASLAYAGSHGSNLPYPHDLNQITNRSTINQVVSGAIPLGISQQFARPFPYWGTISGNSYNAISNYNALQAQVNKHFSNGLLFSFNYVWSHFLDDQDSSGWGNRGGTQTWQNGLEPGTNYGNSNFDIRNAFKGYAAYDLPFGKGKEFMNSNKVLDEVLGGWRLAGTFIAQSGNPFTIVDTASNIFSNSKYTDCGNGCATFPNVVGDWHVSNPSIHRWFNTAAFAAPTVWGNERRNQLVGPRLSVLNLSLGKTFTVTERVHLEVRSDWVNALNHPSFNRPNNDLGNPAEFGLIDPNSQSGGIAVAPRSGQLSARVTF
jgi:Carboxypeptidase regulatory-like domain